MAYEVPWTDCDVMMKAVAAQRDTPLGVMDTLTRECITYWMPELMLHVDSIQEKRVHNITVDVTPYKTLFNDFRYQVLDVLSRIDHDGDEAVKQLKTAITTQTHTHLSNIFMPMRDELTDQEKHDYHPDRMAPSWTNKIKTSARKSKPISGPMTEARILNSSLAWDVRPSRQSPAQVPLSRKRRYSEVRSSPEPDPADNGQVWNSPKLDLKRPKLEFRSTHTIRLSDKHQGYTTHSRHELDGVSPRKHNTVDLTKDGSEYEQENRAGYTFGDQSPSASEFSMPGAFC